MPNAASFFAILTLVFCLTLFDGQHKLFRDSDSGWHIRNGEAILDSHRLPHADPYSFSRPGAPWVSWEWGADVMMALAHRADGLRGVAALYALAIAAVTWLWFQLHWSSGTTFLLACALAPLMLTTANLHWLARPHVFGWVLLLMALLWADRGIRRPWLALPLAAVWTNIHGSFFLAPVVFAAYGLLAEWRHYAAAAAFAVLGTLLNPYGWQLHAHVLDYLTNSELLRRIGEFQTFNFQIEGAAQILLALAVCGTGAVLAATQGRWTHALLMGLLVWIALRSARGLPLMAVAVMPFAGAAITRWLRDMPRWKSAFEYSSNLAALDRGLQGWYAIPACLVLAAGLAHTRPTGFPVEEFPVTTASAIPLGARVFAPDKFGGYLIYRFAGTLPVFFDGRSDFYGLPFMKEYIRIVEVRPGWRPLFDRWKFSHALLPTDAPLRAALESLGWQVRSTDAASVLLAAPEVTPQT